MARVLSAVIYVITENDAHGKPSSKLQTMLQASMLKGTMARLLPPSLLRTL